MYDTQPPLEDPTEPELRSEILEAKLRLIFEEAALKTSSTVKVHNTPEVRTAIAELMRTAGIDRCEAVLEDLIYQCRGMFKPHLNRIKTLNQ